MIHQNICEVRGQTIRKLGKGGGEESKALQKEIRPLRSSVKELHLYHKYDSKFPPECPKIAI